MAMQLSNFLQAELPVLLLLRELVVALPLIEHQPYTSHAGVLVFQQEYTNGKVLHLTLEESSILVLDTFAYHTPGHTVLLYLLLFE